MGTLCPGKGRGLDSQQGPGGRPDLYLDTLIAQQLYACPSIETTTPVKPEHGLGPCTGYIGHPFGKSQNKTERVCLHWLQMDVQRGYNLRM